MKHKQRPVLILSKADDTDYVILPVSTISNYNDRDTYYDVELDPTKYTKISLSKISYIRSHKQTTVNLAQIGRMVGDLKAEYEDLYLEILAKREEFSNVISDDAIE